MRQCTGKYFLTYKQVFFHVGLHKLQMLSGSEYFRYYNKYAMQVIGLVL